MLSGLRSPKNTLRYLVDPFSRSFFEASGKMLFLTPSASPWTLVVMLLHVTVISLLYQLGLVLLGNWVALRLKGIPSAQLWARRLAGVALIGFAVKLAANNR